MKYITKMEKKGLKTGWYESGGFRAAFLSINKGLSIIYFVNAPGRQPAGILPLGF